KGQGVAAMSRKPVDLPPQGVPGLRGEVRLEIVIKCAGEIDMVPRALHRHVANVARRRRHCRQRRVDRPPGKVDRPRGVAQRSERGFGSEASWIELAMIRGGHAHGELMDEEGHLTESEPQASCALGHGNRTWGAGRRLGVGLASARCAGTAPSWQWPGWSAAL